MANLIPLSNSSLIKPKKSAVVKADKLLSSKVKSSAIVKFSGKTSEALVGGALVEIEKKIIQVDKLLKDSLLLSKKEGEKKRVGEEQKDFESKEKELEKNKPKPIPGITLPSLPKMGFFDWIKNFVTQTILGFFAVRLIEHLPKLLSLLPTIIKVSDFVVGVGGKLLDGLISFVDFGYKAYDATRGFVKNLGGNELVKNFDKFAGALNTMMDVAVLAAISAASMGDDGFGGDVAKDAARRGARGVFGRGGARAGTRLGLKLIGKDATKQVLRFIKPIAGRAPLIGGLLEFGISWALGDPIGKAAFKGVGATLLGAIGTAIGGPIGLAIGGLAGGELGGLLYDMFFSGKKPPNKVAKAAGGGSPSTRGGKLVSGPAKRTLKKKKKPRTLTFTPRKIKPGANTGGEAKVQQVFPNPEKAWWDPLGAFTGGNKQSQQPQQKPKEKTANPQQFLVGSNDVLGRAKFFGPFATIVLKSVLGQTPDDLDYKNAGKGLNAWVQTTFGGGTLGFAGGGEVDSKQYFGGEDYTDVISKTIKESVTKEVDTTIRNLSKELALKPAVGKDEMIQENIRRGTEGGGGSGGAGSASELFEIIAGGEGGYNSVNRGVAGDSPGGAIKYFGKNLTDMTVGELMNLQSAGRMFAAGKYQIIPDTMKGFIRQMRIKPTDRYDAATQEKFPEYVMNFKRPIVGKYIRGETDNRAEATQELAREFASVGLAYPEAGKRRGQSRYAGSAGNRASIPPEKIEAALDRARNGGSANRGAVPNIQNLPSTSQAKSLSRGSITSYFGSKESFRKKGHEGVDIGLNQGTPLSFKMGGRVINSFKTSSGDREAGGGYGSYMDVKLDNGNILRLAHLSKIFPGSQFKAGSVVALSGGQPGAPGSGRSGGPHLHLEQHSAKLGTDETLKGKLDPVKYGGFGLVQTGGIVPRFHGGPILKTGYLFGHKGEFVIDKDSVDLFGVDFIDSINRVENQSQLIAKAPSIIEKLKAISGYPYYENREPEVVFIEVPSPPEVLSVPMGSGGGVFVGGGVNNTVPGMEALNAIG
jgi:murein DD-endopeptidase MepM/ murein hydrolase activator NlpD